VLWQVSGWLGVEVLGQYMGNFEQDIRNEKCKDHGLCSSYLDIQ
jgi:hypothetical protein